MCACENVQTCMHMQLCVTVSVCVCVCCLTSSLRKAQTQEKKVKERGSHRKSRMAIIIYILHLATFSYNDCGL